MRNGSFEAIFAFDAELRHTSWYSTKDFGPQRLMAMENGFTEDRIDSVRCLLYIAT